jgi:hypothetical protein
MAMVDTGSYQLTKHLLVRDIIPYLTKHGWHRVPHPNDHLFVFEGMLDDYGNSIQLILPSRDDFGDSLLRLAEAVKLLADIENRLPETVLADIQEEASKLVRHSYVSQENERHKSSYENTYFLIRQCLRKTHFVDKKRTSSKLAKEKGWRATLRQHLFENPYFTSLGIAVFPYLFLFPGSLIIRNSTSNIYVHLTWLLTVIFLSLGLHFYLQKITPKLEMTYDERWRLALDEYLIASGIKLKFDGKSKQLNEAKIRIQRAISYYKKEGVTLKLILNLMWGSIVIGCLPDPAFQQALATLSLSEVWSTNPLGTFALLIVPFVGVVYFVRYGLPVAWMEQVISQIELASDE